LRDRALGLLARREHARAELARKLAERGFAAAAVAEVTSALAAEGLVSDARFAAAFVRERIERGWGPLRIRRDLEARGAEPDAVERALAEADADWVRRAALARARRFGEAAPGDYPEWARQARFLERRGFTREQIRRALGRP